MHRIAHHIGVHPKSVALRLKYLLQSGLISIIRFVIDDRFTHKEKYVFLFDQLPSITKTMINHYLAFPFVKRSCMERSGTWTFLTRLSFDLSADSQAFFFPLSIAKISTES